MTTRTSALWACLLLASIVSAQQSYKVRSGDTIEKIAVRAGVSQKAILQANPGLKPTRLQIGQTIRISATKSSATKPTARKTNPSGGYTVRNGDHDWLIARKLGISVTALHSANPNAKWRALQPGQTLRIPGGGSSPASVRTISAPVRASGSHAVKSGENDWIIAKRYGTSVSKLHALNPSVKWSRLQIGQKIRVPGAASSGPVAQANSKLSGSAKVVRDGSIVRRRPTTDAGRVNLVGQGAVAKILDRDGDWYRLRFSGGTEGWMRRDLLAQGPAIRTTSTTRPSSITRVASSKSKSTKKSGYLAMASVGSTSNVIGKAQQYLGVRYRYGGTSRSGFDCSGFVGHVYRSNGVRLPRTSSEMSRVGSKVSKGSLKQGDLVFFKTNRGTRINHVGIYVGNGKFIHASSGGGHVKVDSLNSGYYQRRYAGAKRVANVKTRSTSTVAKATPAKTAPDAKVANADPTPEPQRSAVHTDTTTP